MDMDGVQHNEREPAIEFDKAKRRRNVVRIGCGAGFGGDRPAAALRLLQRVRDMNYLVLECLAERTLANRYEAMVAGGTGYDPRSTKMSTLVYPVYSFSLMDSHDGCGTVSEWMELLLPQAVSKGVCLITNMGACSGLGAGGTVDCLGAQEAVLKAAAELGLSITVAVAYEIPDSEQGCSTYLGAAPIVHVLETSNPDVIITSRVADASLFLAPMVYELGWKWHDWKYLAQGTLAGHLLECGCQLTGGYFMHPADPHRIFSAKQLLDASLPFADVRWDGELMLGKADNSGGELSAATCSQQLLYEIGDPAAYITPDVVVNFSNVTFQTLTGDRVLAKGAEPAEQSAPKSLLRLVPQHCGWKGWGEISYGGNLCVERAAAADYLVRAWLEEAYPGTSRCILSYNIGENSLQFNFLNEPASQRPAPREARLRMDGLFATKMHAARFIRDFEALYTNGPAGGGGIRTGQNQDLILKKCLVLREQVRWKTSASHGPQIELAPGTKHASDLTADFKQALAVDIPSPNSLRPAPAGLKLPLYEVAHGRTGDKGNQLNVSIIPHCPSDVARLRAIITPTWMMQLMEPLFTKPRHLDLNFTSEGISERNEHEDGMLVDFYEVQGVAALNIVVKDVLDGGVTCSRRLDRHGKTLSDLVLSQEVVLPP